MKLVDKIIQEYKEASKEIYRDYEPSFYSYYASSKYFDTEYYAEELNQLTEIMDKFALLKFTQNEVKRELSMAKAHINSCQVFLKLGKTNEIWSNLDKPRDEVIKEYKEMIEYSNCAIKELSSLMKFLESEINELKSIKQSDPIMITNDSLETKSNSKNRSLKVENKKIAWNLTQTDLIDFFELMKMHNLITEDTYEKMNIVIRDCFTDKFGKSYDNQNIAKSKYNKSKKSKNFFKIEKTIEDFENKRKPSA